MNIKSTLCLDQLQQETEDLKCNDNRWAIAMDGETPKQVIA